MPNDIFRQDMISRLSAAIRNSELVASQLSHPGVKGKLREFLVKQILKPVLPDRFRIGTGLVTDQFGTQSNETDIVVYDAEDIRPLLFGDTDAVFPIESTRYCFEVKSKLTAREIRTTVDKFRRLLSLSSMNVYPVRVLVAWSTDLSSAEDELDRYLSVDSDYLNGPAVDIICIVGKGYWYFFPERNGNQTTIHRWSFIPSTEDHLELLGLISGVANTLNPRSPLGYYILPPRLSPTGYFEIPHLNIVIPSSRIRYFNDFNDAVDNGDLSTAADAIVKAIPDRDARSRFMSIKDPSDPQGTSAISRMKDQFPDLW